MPSSLVLVSLVGCHLPSSEMLTCSFPQVCKGA